MYPWVENTIFKQKDYDDLTFFYPFSLQVSVMR